MAMLIAAADKVTKSGVNMFPESKHAASESSAKMILNPGDRAFSLELCAMATIEYIL